MKEKLSRLARARCMKPGDITIRLTRHVNIGLQHGLRKNRLFIVRRLPPTIKGDSGASITLRSNEYRVIATEDKP